MVACCSSQGLRLLRFSPRFATHTYTSIPVQPPGIAESASNHFLAAGRIASLWLDPPAQKRCPTCFGCKIKSVSHSKTHQARSREAEDKGLQPGKLKGEAPAEVCPGFGSKSWSIPPTRYLGSQVPILLSHKNSASRIHSTSLSKLEMGTTEEGSKLNREEVNTTEAPPKSKEDTDTGKQEPMRPQKGVKEKSQAERKDDQEEGASTSNLHNRVSRSKYGAPLDRCQKLFEYSEQGGPYDFGDLSTITVGGFTLQGVSVGGQETCIMIPSMKIAFDVGRCPQRAVFQENVLISHAHMDHIGGVCLQAATRGLFSLKPPRIVVPKVIVPAVENLFNAFRALDNAELEHQLIGLEGIENAYRCGCKIKRIHTVWIRDGVALVTKADVLFDEQRSQSRCIKVGEELRLTGELFVKPFQTYHVVPSQGYVVYSRRQKLKKEFVGLPGPEIGRLRRSGVEITDVEEVPEVAFTGDTTAEFITDPANADVLRAKLLIMEMTFIDDSSTIEHARKWGHTHIDEVVPLAHLFQNEAILFIHFSARYRRRDILEAIEGLPPGFREKVTPLLERF